MISKYGGFLAIVFIAIAAGCNSNLTPQPTLNPGSLSADFPSGAEFLSTSATVVDQSGTYQISAVQNIAGAPSDEIQLSIPANPNLTVPYTVTEQNGSMTIYFNDLTNNSYDANSAQGNCTITVLQTSPTFEGNFTARAVCSSIPDTIILSNGQFNATYQ